MKNNISNNIEEFKNWMNKKHPMNSVNQYCVYLGYPEHSTIIPNEYRKTFFTYEDIESCKKVENVLDNYLSNETVFDVDENKNKKKISNFKSALEKYKDFLMGKNKVSNMIKYDKEPSRLVNKFTTLLKSTRNLILTGAPGTGKTYLAKEIAAAMGCTENEIGFVQFHPSYDYTDFVEGLRPVSKDGCDNIGFERRDGVFKEICKRALENLLDSEKSLKTLQEEKSIEESVVDYIDNAINNNVKISLVNGGKFSIVEFDKNKIIAKNKEVEGGTLRVSLNDLYQLLNRTDLNDLKNVKEIKKVISRKWSTQQDSYTFALYKEIKKIESEQKIKEEESVQNISKKAFVFIIDEIK
jgi:predicted AAA+ superfamily ATPase